MKHNLLMDMPERLMSVWKDKVQRKNIKWGDNLQKEKALAAAPAQPPKKDCFKVELEQHVSLL